MDSRREAVAGVDLDMKYCPQCDEEYRPDIIVFIVVLNLSVAD